MTPDINNVQELPQYALVSSLGPFLFETAGDHALQWPVA